MIKFNIPFIGGNEEEYFKESLALRNFCGRGPFTVKAETFLKTDLGSKEVLLTPSCTHALEMSAMLLNIEEGDEVIMPSFTFVSTALAFVNRGARIKFVDIRQDTLNIDETLIEAAITKKTKAIVPVHYAGISAEMNTIMNIAKNYNLTVVEDAAQGINCSYFGKKLGSIGELGSLSFHETKNIHCGEGGALILNREDLVERAEILREKGTNRKKFFEGQVDKYTWVDIGSSYLLNDYSAAFLLAQLHNKDLNTSKRKAIWNKYNEALNPLKEYGVILPTVPNGIEFNGHIFYILTRSHSERKELLQYLKDKEIFATSHYVPLHTSDYGKKVGEFIGQDKFTSDLSLRLLRLPMHTSLSDEDIAKVCSSIKEFYKC
jgi:dTDP-4-amino-4,6-dideoxygalactose transaminase